MQGCGKTEMFRYFSRKKMRSNLEPRQNFGIFHLGFCEKKSHDFSFGFFLRSPIPKQPLFEPLNLKVGFLEPEDPCKPVQPVQPVKKPNPKPVETKTEPTRDLEKKP